MSRKRKSKIYKPPQSYKALENIVDSIVDKVPDEVLQTNFTENNLTENQYTLNFSERLL